MITNNYRFKVSEYEGKDFKTVDIIIENDNLSYSDNTVYVPQFISSVEQSIERLKTLNYAKYEKEYRDKSVKEVHAFMLKEENEEVYALHRFMDWGPTTDNVTSLLFVHKNELILSYELWREEGNVHYVKVEKSELLKRLKKLLIEIEEI